MKKSKSVFFLLIFSILIGSFFLLNYFSVYYEPNSSENTLVKYFRLSKANVENSEMYFWCKTKDVFDKEKDIEQIAEEFANDLEISLSGNPIKVKNDSENFIQSIEIKGEMKNKYINSDKPIYVSINVSETKETKSEITVSVDIIQNKSYAELYEIKKLVLEEYKNYDMVPETSSCIEGSYNAKMSITEMNELCKGVFSEADAEKIEAMEDENLISVAAYSPNINSSVNVSGKRINLSLAMRYKSSEKKTYIWLGTPIITIEY